MAPALRRHALIQGFCTAIRTVIPRLHRLTPSLVDQPVSVIEDRLRDQEEGIPGQLGLSSCEIQGTNDEDLSGNLF